MAILVEPVSSYLRQLVRNKNNAELISAFDSYGKEVKIAQRGKQILINSGVKTGAMEIKPTTTHRDVMKFFMKIVQENSMAGKKGFKLNA